MARKADSAPTPPDGAVADAPPKGKGKGKLFLFLVPALIVGLLSGTALGVAQNDTMTRIQLMMAAESAAEAAVAEAEAAEAAAGQDPNVPEEFGSFSEITGLIVNPAGTDGGRFLMLNVAFEGSPEVIAELATRDMVIKDRFLKHLAEQPVERLAAYTVRDSLKQELLANANAVLKVGQIDRLYFTQYVLQ